MRLVAGVSTLEAGDRAVLDAGDGGVDEVEVLSISGPRADVRFDSGAELRVQVHHLGLAPVHHAHRAGDPDTSIAAATAAQEQLTRNQTVVLAALAAAGARGMIDHDHEAVNGLEQDTAGKRRKELQELGMVAQSPLRRKTPRGRDAIVWTITAAGVAVNRLQQKRGVA